MSRFPGTALITPLAIVIALAAPAAGVANSAVVLHDQMGTSEADGPPSQNFQGIYDPYDSQAADDFVVPGGQTWLIETVEVLGKYLNDFGGGSRVDVVFYADAGTVPGAALYTYAGVVATSAVQSGDFTIPLSPPASFGPGTYWVSVVRNQSVGDDFQWSWSSRTDRSNDPSVWQNPGGGFATACRTWTAFGACVTSGGAEPDLLFRLLGSITADTSPPETTIDSGPTGTVTSSSATFTFSSSEPGSTFACSLDGAAFASCTSPAVYTGLAQGSHTLAVRATDAAGNTDASPATRTWTVAVYDQIDTPEAAGPPSQNFIAVLDQSDSQAADDFVVPGGQTWLIDTVEVLGTYLNDIGGGSSVDVVFYADAGTVPGAAVYTYAGASATSAAQSGDFTIPLSPPASLGPGTYWLSVVRNQGFDNWQWSWSIRAGQSNDPSVWRNPANGIGTGCTAWTPIAACVLGEQPDFDLLFRLRGSIDDLDTTAPETTIDSGPTGTVSTAQATFTFSSSEPGSTFACSLDSATFASCSSPTVYTGLAQGSHAFAVRATDSAGNTDATPAARTWTVATTAFKPDGRIRKGTGAFVGNNVYSATGVNQSKSGSAAKGGTISFGISVQNDAASGADSFKLLATGAASTMYGVTYFRGTTNITAAVLAGTYTTPSLAPGATYLITAKVKVNASATVGSSVTRIVLVTSVADATRRDAVELIGKRN